MTPDPDNAVSAEAEAWKQLWLAIALRHWSACACLPEQIAARVLGSRALHAVEHEAHLIS